MLEHSAAAAAVRNVDDWRRLRHHLPTTSPAVLPASLSAVVLPD